MPSFIEQNKLAVKSRHYVGNATAPNRWYNFYRTRVSGLKDKFDDNFCLIINGSHDEDDAYVLPFSEFKSFYISDYLDHHDRWVGTIKDGRIRLTSPSKKTKSISAAPYYNAFQNLDAVFPPPESDQNFEREVVHSADRMSHEDIRDLIREINAHYANAEPVKRVQISERIDRPNAISDYLKTLHDYKCQICKQKGFRQRNGAYYIEVHHIIELHNLLPGSYCSDNIVVVCANCHRKFHYASVKLLKEVNGLVSLAINGEPFAFRRTTLTS